jgi:RNA polymerase sigma factor (sigma-70 family)
MTISPSKESNLVDKHFALVVHQALQFTPSGITDLDDLISVGSIGLLKAVRGFDDSRGIQFSTYATTCIRNEMMRELKKFKAVHYQLMLDVEEPEVSNIWEFLPDYLTQVEKEILYMRLGETRTFKEIGEKMNRTKAWASAKMIEILDKIRESNGY